LGAVASVYDELKKLNAEVIAISCDTEFSHWMWRKTSPTIAKVEYAIASDPGGAIARAYGVYLEDEGLATRGRFLIDPEGVVRAVEMLPPPVGRSTAELLRQLQAFQAVDANPGKAAPAGWQPGDDLIETGLEYIGKY